MIVSFLFQASTHFKKSNSWGWSRMLATILLVDYYSHKVRGWGGNYVGLVILKKGRIECDSR